MILWLMLLTPGIPEYMTGSSPITNLVVNPPAFLLQLAANVGLYTTGVLLIREWALRVRKGWTSILILGAAYGIVEEGLAVHTFFQAHGDPVGRLAVYGHYLGINLVWAVGITAFHAFYSVALPLLILAVAFPEWKDRPLLRRRGVSVTAALYVLDALVLNVAAPNKPHLVWYLVLLLVVAALASLAGRIGEPAIAPSVVDAVDRHPVGAGMLAFGSYLLFALILPVVFRIPVLLDFVLLVPLATAPVLFFLHTAGRNGLEHETFRFIAGMMAMMIVWAEFIEIRGVRGISLVSILAIYLLVKLKHRLLRRRCDHGGAVAART
jgi:hypothetical protein